MIIIYNTETYEVINNMGSNALYPDGNIPNLSPLPSGQAYLKLHDNSQHAKTIRESREYELEFKDEEFFAVNQIKSYAEAQQEEKDKKENKAKTFLESTSCEFSALLEDLVLKLDKLPSVTLPDRLKELATQRKNARSKL